MYLKIHRISAPKMEPLVSVDFVTDLDIKNTITVMKAFGKFATVSLRTDENTSLVINTKDISYVEFFDVPEKYFED